MRTVPDALRSLARFVSEVMGDEWEVRFAVEEGTFRRPFARVGLSGPTPMTGPAHSVDVIAPFAISLWPETGITPEESLFLALAVEERLVQAVRVTGGDGCVSPRRASAVTV